MMKKTLLSILIILGLSYSTQSMADVKNLPIICKYTDVGFGPGHKIKDSYSLYNTEIEQMIKKLFENPELILKQGFIDHEAMIKKLNLKCPAGVRMIKPYKEKDYRKDKFKISYKYISEIRKRTKKGYYAKTTRNNETPHTIFLIYLLSLYSDYNFEEHKIIVGRRCWDLWYEQYFDISKPSPVVSFTCLQYYFHKKQAEKNNRDYIELNYRIVELPSKKISEEELKKTNLDTALGNLPNICKMSVSWSTSGRKPIGLNLSESYWGIRSDQRDKDNFNQLITVLAKHPELFFTKDLGFRQLNCGTADNTYMSEGLSRIKLTIKPYDEKALKKGEYKLSKVYLNNVKKLDSKEKERLKFLINLITLNDNILLPSDVDDKTKKTFKINFGNLKTAYDQLQNSEAYQFVSKVNQARVGFKILLLLL